MAVMLPRLLGAVVGLAVAGMVTAAQAVTYKFEITAGEIKTHLDPELPMDENAVYEVWFGAPDGYTIDSLVSPLPGGWGTDIQFETFSGDRSGYKAYPVVPGFADMKLVPAA